MFDDKNKLYTIFKELSDDFGEWKVLKKKNYNYYNTLERILLSIDTLSEWELRSSISSTNKKLSIGSIVHKIKILAMEM